MNQISLSILKVHATNMFNPPSDVMAARDHMVHVVRSLMQPAKVYDRCSYVVLSKQLIIFHEARPHTKYIFASLNKAQKLAVTVANAKNFKI